MATASHDQTGSRRKSHLGIWWRLWIAFTIWQIAAVLALVTFAICWEGSVLRVLAGCAAYPVLLLAIGQTMAWVRRGRSR